MSSAVTPAQAQSLSFADRDIDTIIEALGMKPHPEGGWYAETHRIPSPVGERSPGTAIYYLLKGGPAARWHRVDATEVWHHYAGGPLALSIVGEDGQTRTHALGKDIGKGERPQVIVPPHAWQAAQALGAWTLCGCTVSPGFEFEKFEMAPEGWSPPAK
jgi:predicted cupin superfamily sugar epimerase